ncbi:MAG TPA: hypothetical protein VFQ39_06665, partial [Longimicrobium sp.]|nr:hypothetical protein [Longimicrobium sp.]
GLILHAGRRRPGAAGIRAPGHLFAIDLRFTDRKKTFSFDAETVGVIPFRIRFIPPIASSSILFS